MQELCKSFEVFLIAGENGFYSPNSLRNRKVIGSSPMGGSSKTNSLVRLYGRTFVIYLKSYLRDRKKLSFKIDNGQKAKLLLKNLLLIADLRG